MRYNKTVNSGRGTRSCFFDESPRAVLHGASGRQVSCLIRCLYTSLCTYLATYLHTPWSRVLLEKPTGLQLVKKFPAFYGTRRFITTFTSARHLSLSWDSSIQSKPPLIPLPIYARVFQVVCFPQVSQPKPCIRLPSSLYVLHAPPISFFIIYNLYSSCMPLWLRQGQLYLYVDFLVRSNVQSQMSEFFVASVQRHLFSLRVIVGLHFSYCVCGNVQWTKPEKWIGLNAMCFQKHIQATYTFIYICLLFRVVCLVTSFPFLYPIKPVKHGCICMRHPL